MRVRQLSLAPYGAFEDLTLRFSDAAGLHLVFGPNGAGKSTTLEALRSVLFGMTAGAQSFRFDSSRLRLRAELVRANGEGIAFTRRTATKAPLWNALDDTELEAERLAPFLGNFDRQQFVTLFGLDLETMVAGGRDLLKGEGDIGRALFGAGLGGQRLANVIARLDEDERDLYAERSSKPRVNRALSEYDEVSKALKRATLSESALEGDRRKLTTARKEQDAAIERQRALRRRIDGLMQLARALAALGPLEDKRRARAALGEFTPFDGETSARVQRSADERAKLLASQEERQRRVAEAEATQVHLRAEARADVLEAVPAVDALSQRRGAFRAAAEDLVQARAEHNEAQAKRGEALRRAGAERAAAATGAAADGSAADGSAADGAAATGTTDELAEAADAHIERMQRAESEVKRAAREAKHAAVWLSRAQADAARSRAERAAEVAAALDDLAPFDGRASATPSPVGVPSAQQARDVWAELDALRALRLPSKSTLEAHERAWAALEDERALLAQRSGALESELRAVEAQLQELALAPEGAPPTRAEVEAARRARDAALIAAFRATPTPDVALTVERAMRLADDLVDRHADQAVQAARRAQLEAALGRLRPELEGVQGQESARAARAGDALAEWRASWSGAGFVPLSPSEMLRWCERRAALLGRDADVTARERATVRQAEEAHALRAADLDAAREFEGEAQAAWTAWAAAQHLDPNAGPEAARRRLRSLVDVRAAEAQLARAAARAEQKRQVLDAFARDVAATCDALLVRVDEETLGDALAHDDAEVALADARLTRLIAAVEGAKRAQSQLVALERQLASEAAEATLAAARLGELQRAIDAIGAEFGLASTAQCVARALASDQARALDEEIARLTRAFHEHAGGRTPEAVLEEAGERETADLEVELRALQEELAALEDQSAERASRVAQLAARVEGLGSDEAAMHEARLAELEAELEGDVRAYLHTKLARRLLEREVDRYRRETQGPILARAQALFQTLTLGAYAQLHPSEDRGRAVMVARRPDGQTVHVDGMSTGTRDQLYLALRIASVEHMLRVAEPMPFIADDLFVNFDDERTEAALRVLAELGATTQVIVFSHHSRVAETAERLTRTGVAVDVVRLLGESERAAQGALE